MTWLLDALSYLCLGLGVLFSIVGGIGILRLPDLYTRSHAATLTDTMGAGLVLTGLMLQAGFTNVSVKLLLTLAFVLFTSPAAGHALVKAAYAHGLEAKIEKRE